MKSYISLKNSSQGKLKKMFILGGGIFFITLGIIRNDIFVVALGIAGVLAAKAARTIEIKETGITISHWIVKKIVSQEYPFSVFSEVIIDTRGTTENEVKISLIKNKLPSHGYFSKDDLDDLLEFIAQYNNNIKVRFYRNR
jgi:hypothetical protein